MAQYTVKMSCGHTDTVSLTGKSADREKRIKYLEENGLCKDCYKKQLAEQAKEEGLVFNASVLPMVSKNTGNILLSVWFSGDTLPYKDAIKEIGGYRWDRRESAQDAFLLKVPPMCWKKTISMDSLQQEVSKAVAIGAKSAVSEEGLFAGIHYQIALQKQEEWKKEQEKVSMIEKPSVPELLKGHHWNQKIYGKPGNYTVYLDGKRMPITDEEEKAIQSYMAARKEYKRMVENIAP